MSKHIPEGLGIIVHLDRLVMGNTPMPNENIINKITIMKCLASNDSKHYCEPFGFLTDGIYKKRDKVYCKS